MAYMLINLLYTYCIQSMIYQSIIIDQSSKQLRDLLITVIS